MMWLFEPNIFNKIILVMYSLAALRWTLAGKYSDALYWVFAFGITATVTFGYKR